MELSLGTRHGGATCAWRLLRERIGLCADEVGLALQSQISYPLHPAVLPKHSQSEATESANEIEINTNEIEIEIAINSYETLQIQEFHSATQKGRLPSGRPHPSVCQYAA